MQVSVGRPRAMPSLRPRCQVSISRSLEQPGKPSRLYGSSSQICRRSDAFIDHSRSGQYTRFAAITGPGTAFEDEHPLSLKDLPNDTILIAEVRSGVQHWMKPGGDLHIDKMPQCIDVQSGHGISGHDPEGFFVTFADGAIRLISNNVPFNELKKFFTLRGAKKFDRDKSLGKYRLY